MRNDKAMRGIVATAAVMLMLLSPLAAAGAVVDPLLAVDTDKLNDGGDLWFKDSWIDDQMHSPHEAISATVQLNMITGPDYSCWIATASNMLAYEGYAANYLGAIRLGAASVAAGVPNPTGWGGGSAGPPSSGDRYTFDDPGLIDWHLRYVGLTPLDPITTTPFDGTWPGPPTTPPVEWCIQRLEEGHPVGLGVYWGALDSWWLGSYTAQRGGHAITLWKVVPEDPQDPTRGTLIITDSDDGRASASRRYPAADTREVHFVYEYGAWMITDLKVLENPMCVCVRYAVALSDDPSPVQPASWTRIKAIYR